MKLVDWLFDRNRDKRKQEEVKLEKERIRLDQERVRLDREKIKLDLDKKILKMKREYLMRLSFGKDYKGIKQEN